MPSILFYDGSCGLCARSVQWVLAHERTDHSLRFATLKGRLASEAFAMHPELKSVDSVVWYDAGDSVLPAVVLVKSEAVLRAWRYVGGIWRLPAAVGGLLPRTVRDRLYDLAARHRHHLFSGPACVVPAPSQRARFPEIDAG